MFKKIFVGILIVAASVCSRAFAEEARPVNEDKVSLEAVQSWLASVDQGQYDQSWQSTSEYFKSLVTNDQWKTQIQGVRQPMGNVLSREMKTQEHKTSLPGALDGNYYVFTFATSFTNKKEAVETVTVMMDKDNQWHAAGYFIK